MSYTLLTGSFVIRYPDRPRGGPEPDGDTVKFRPDTPALVELLPRVSRSGPSLGARGISVRLEAIDALETHFMDAHQELAGANAARDALLAELGFTNVVFFDDLPNQVRSADQDSVSGWVLSNGIDDNGRMIGFVFGGDPVRPDASSVFVDEALLDRSANAKLLAGGYAYPAFYATLPAALRTHLALASRAARADDRGIWARSTADPNGRATVPDLAALERLVIWPKLFRRIVAYLAGGFSDLADFDSWLRADPVTRDDALFQLDRMEHGNLHDVVRASGHTIALTAWPDAFVITPDPAVAAAPVAAPRPAAGDVVVVAALPSPAGSEAETVTLLNVSAAPVDLAGWSLSDSAGGRLAVGGRLAAGETLRVRLTGALALDDAGDTLRLVDDRGAVVDRVGYRAGQVRRGRTVAFGR